MIVEGPITVVRKFVTTPPPWGQCQQGFAQPKTEDVDLRGYVSAPFVAVSSWGTYVQRGAVVCVGPIIMPDANDAEDKLAETDCKTTQPDSKAVTFPAISVFALSVPEERQRYSGQKTLTLLGIYYKISWTIFAFCL